MMRSGEMSRAELRERLVELAHEEKATGYRGAKEAPNHRPSVDDVVTVAGRAGSALAFEGRLWHDRAIGVASGLPRLLG